MRDLFLWSSSVALALVVGLLLGVVFGNLLHTEAHPPVLLAGSGAGAATVLLEGFRDGALRGRATGPIRLFAREDPVEVGADGAFAIVHPAFRIQEISVAVPAGMRFVASKKGKKYYAVDSAAGEKIVPENRRYFPDRASAEAAGYVK